MKESIFFDIDTQYDFMSRKGKLYVPKAERIIPKLSLLTKFAKRNSIRILASVDKHKKYDLEFKQFPPHCVGGSSGQRKIIQTKLANAIYLPCKKIKNDKLKLALKKNQIVFEKKTFDVFSNPNLKLFLKNISAVYVYGVALDYCVKAVCAGLRQKKINTYLVTDATEAVYKKNVGPALNELKTKGVKFITVKRLINKLSKNK